jgi:hypothetical protein
MRKSERINPKSQITNSKYVCYLVLGIWDLTYEVA